MRHHSFLGMLIMLLCALVLWLAGCGSGGGTASGTSPTVSSFSPNYGPAGITVTITGTNLTGATVVKFNGTASSSITAVTATSLQAVVPSGATSGTISVTTPAGTGTSSGSFTVDVIKVGDQWVYQYFDANGSLQYTETRTFTTQTTFSGYSAFRMDSTYSSPAMSPYSAYYNWDAKGLEYYGTSSTADVVVFTPPQLLFPALVSSGETWTFSGTSTETIASTPPQSVPYSYSGQIIDIEAVTVPAGTFANAAKVNWVDTTNNLAKIGWHVPGIGWVKEQYWDGTYELLQSYTIK